MENNKKISFGFSKISKKHEIFSKPPKTEKKIDLIDCLEGQSIKIKDAIEEVKGPLIIPIKDTSKNLLDRVKEAKEKRIKSEIKQEDEVPDSALSIDELAARELIREAQNRDVAKNNTKVFTLPLTEDKFVAEGEAEPSLEDYESVPISDYGMAMLRGMGWKEGMPIGKTQSKTVTPIIPELRPKGLGLGANKMVNANKPAQNLDKNGKEMQLVKGAFAKIIAGNHKGHYCEVQGFDDENCRIIVKTALTYEILTLNEFLIIPVTKEEYALGSKIINNAKYEEYKEKTSEERGEGSRRHSRSRSREKYRKKKSNKSASDSEADDYKKKKNKKKSKKSKHNSSDSDYEKRRKPKKKSKSRHKSSESESDDDYKKKSERRHRR